jgi:undecaprenyl diphosphate synthase
MMSMQSAEKLPDTLPAHIAIIMDGNGRWAKARGLPRAAGHRKGVEAVRRIVKAAGELGIVDLMGLLRRYLRAETADLHRSNVRLRMIGDPAMLEADIVALIEGAEDQMRDNTGLNLTVALSYGGRQELTAAARALARAVSEGRLSPEDIDETVFESYLSTCGIPDPDMLIRTSGELRVSNFLLWQTAYTELVFSDVLWPDFGREELEAAIREYGRRERRYGAAVG